MDTHSSSHFPSRSPGRRPRRRPPRSCAGGRKTECCLFRLGRGLTGSRSPFSRFWTTANSFDRVCSRREVWNTNLAAARLVRVVDFGTSSISSSCSSSLSSSTWVSRTSEEECEAQLTMRFFPELDAFLPVTVDVAALLPLLVPAFFADGGPISKPKSLPGSSISIAMESTDPASSSSASARPLALPLSDKYQYMAGTPNWTPSQTFAPPVLPDLCSAAYCFSRSSRTLSILESFK
jgi:hypothetical protein